MDITLTEFLIVAGLLWVASLVTAAWFGYDWGQSDREWRQVPAWWARRPHWRAAAPSDPYAAPGAAQGAPPAKRRATRADLDAAVQLDRQGQAPAPAGSETAPLARLYGGAYPAPPGTYPRRPRHGMMT